MECQQNSIRLEAQLMQQRWLTLCADYPAVNDHAHLQMLYRTINFLHSKRTSVTWLLSYCAVSWVTCIRRVRKIWEYVPCTDCTGQVNDFELISMVRMETGHPAEGSFGSEFPSICNHWELYGGLKSQDVKIFRNCCVFWKKRLLTVKV